jgi:uncharacterized protein (TIGR02145 family)
MKLRYSYYPLIVTFAVTLLISGCRKDDGNSEAEIPNVTTDHVTNIGKTTATCGGTVSSDGGADVTGRGVCWSTIQSPTISDSLTLDGAGTGKFTSSLTGLTVNTRYYYRAYATNSEGTAYGDEKSFTTRTDTFTDVDGNIYNSQTIGSQQWMVENLRTTRFNDGTDIPQVTDTTAWDTLDTPGYCWYDNNPSKNKATYGAFYNWYTINTEKLCPDGWHVPSNEDWFDLANYLGGEMLAGGKLKDIGESYWKSPNTAASNITGFSALPGGLRGDNGVFGYMGNLGAWWASDGSVYYPDKASFWTLTYNSGSLIYGTWPKVSGFSVRCLKDTVAP